MTDIESLVAQVQFGVEVENFVNSNIGKYLLERADQEVAAGIEKLIVVDPFATEEIQKIQMEITRAQSINRWLAEAVQDGFQAERILTGE